MGGGRRRGKIKGSTWNQEWGGRAAALSRREREQRSSPPTCVFPTAAPHLFFFFVVCARAAATPTHRFPSAMAASSDLRRRLSRSRSLEYDISKLPAAGGEVLASNAAPAPCGRPRDAAGHAFHAFALRQAGVVGERVGGGGGV